MSTEIDTKRKIEAIEELFEPNTIRELIDKYNLTYPFTVTKVVRFSPPEGIKEIPAGEKVRIIASDSLLYLDRFLAAAVGDKANRLILHDSKSWMLG